MRKLAWTALSWMNSIGSNEPMNQCYSSNSVQVSTVRASFLPCGLGLCWGHLQPQNVLDIASLHIWMKECAFNAHFELSNNIDSQVCISNYIVTTRNCIMDKRAPIVRERETHTHTCTHPVQIEWKLWLKLNKLLTWLPSFGIIAEFFPDHIYLQN